MPFLCLPWVDSMKYTKQGKDVVRAFDSWGNFIAAVRDEVSVSKCKRMSRARIEQSFPYKDILTHSIDEAIDLAVNGWYEPEKDIHAFADPLFTGISSLIEREEFIHGDEGMMIDIAEYVNNEPECWINCVPTIADGRGNRVIHLCYSIAYSWKVQAAEIRKKGSLVVALVRLLEFAGYRVKIDVVRCVANYTDDKIFKIAVPVKQPDQPLDIGRICFAFCHPSFKRRMMWSIQETTLDGDLSGSFDTGGGYGRVRDGFVPCDIELGFRTSIRLSNPQQWLIDQLKACGVQLKEKAAGGC